MNYYDELVDGKSLDRLLKEAKQEDAKKEMTLTKIDKNERIGVYENGLAKIIGPQKYEAFSDTLRRISDIESLFHARGDISLVVEKLVELQDVLEPIELPEKIKEFMRNIRNKYSETGMVYLQSLERPSEDDLKIGSKVRTVFVPFFDTKLREDYSVCASYEHGRVNYFNERNKNFPPGSIGEIIGFYTSLFVVQFDKEGKWSEDWRPDSSYWTEKKNSALYDLKELRILPFSAVEVCTLKTLLNKVGNRLEEVIV